MKKKYIEPEIVCCVMDIQQHLCSVSTEGADVSAGYGGVDTGGTLSPSVKGRLWRNDMDQLTNKNGWADGVW